MILSLAANRKKAVDRAVEELKGGRLVVAPTDTIYGLLANAFSPFATAMVFEAKQRPRSLPLPILVSRPKMAWALAGRVPKAAELLAVAFWPGALTLILPEASGLDWDLGDKTGSVAIRMPDREDLLEIISGIGPVAGTSANVSGEPTPRTVRTIAKRLGEKVSLYLDGGRSPADAGSTIVDLTTGDMRVVREGPIAEEDLRRVLDAQA